MRDAVRRVMRSVRKSVKSLIFRLLARAPRLRQRFRLMLYARRGRVYRSLCRRTQVDQRLLVFECFAGRAYCDSPRAIYQRLLDDPRFAEHRFVWVFRPHTTGAFAARGYSVRRVGAGCEDPMDGVLEQRFGEQALEELRRATIVSYASAEYYRLHAEAGAWISNYIVPMHMHVRDGQTYVQTWHGTPLKRLGCDLAGDKQSANYAIDDVHDRYTKEGERFQYLVSPSAFASEKLTSAFGLSPTQRDQKVLETGYPRNDALAAPSAAYADDVRRRLGIPSGKRVVLYAPTFRDTEYEPGVGHTLNPAVDFGLLRQRLCDDHVVLFRSHYLIAASLDLTAYDGFILDVSAVTDVNDLYLVSDILVTDYSSVFFDFANLRRPILYFMYDLEGYRDQLRGFYLGLDELPGPIIQDSAELAEAILEIDAARPALLERIDDFNRKFTYLDDGMAARRAIDALVDAGAIGL